MTERPRTTPGLAQRLDALSPDKKALLLRRNPTSFGQERLWFLERLAPDSAFYNGTVAMRLRGPLDRAVLGRAFEAVMQRQAILRTAFPSIDGEPLQWVAADMPLEIPLEDLSADGRAGAGRTGARRADARRSDARRSGADPLEQIRRWADREVAIPFDIENGPLLRARLLRFSAQDHALLVTVHHILVDRWSITILLADLGRLYQAFHSGLESPLEPLPLQYSDYARWQRKTLEPRPGEPTKALLTELDHWCDRLKGAPPLLELPTDRPRPAISSHHGQRHRFSLTPEMSEAVEAHGREHRATSYMVLLAAFYAVLMRASGQRDLVVGSPVSSRGASVQLEGLIGFFINTLPLRLTNPAGIGFQKLTETVRATTLEAFEHQETPFEKLVEVLGIERSLSHGPLFQVLFTFQNVPRATLDMDPLEAELVELGAGRTPFDLSLVLEQNDQGQIHGFFDYAVDLFDHPSVSRLAAAFRGLLGAALADPSRALEDLPVLDASALQQVIRGFNDTARVWPTAAAETLHGLTFARAAESPRSTALIFEGETLSFGELAERAHRLAHWLRERGVGRGDLVGVCLERSFDLVTALLGVLDAGAAYVPLDPSYPRDRLGFMVEDSGVDHVLTHSEPMARLGAFDKAQCHELDRLEAEGAFEGFPTTPPNTGVTGEDLAYVMYTSGSTGRPKGVMNPHGGVINHLLWLQDQFPLGPDDRVMQKTPFSFDVSLLDLFWPLVQGVPMVLARPGGHGEPEYLAKLIEDQRVTTLHFVPSMLQTFLAQDDLATQTHSLRMVMTSGEALPFELQERCFERIPSARLLNLYGPTEAAVNVTGWWCRPGDPRGLVPIGQPLDNCTVFVVDPRLQPVPQLWHGELLLGGCHLADGYHRRPALTAERFVPDPFGEAPGARLYRTGDLCRWLDDGTVDFLGRIDHQVKVRGQRIELGEIEARLATHPAVREAVVIAHAGRTQADTQLVGYWTADIDEPWPSGDELNAYLAVDLPEYMVPSMFLRLDIFPLTPSGKVDRRSLPDPGQWVETVAFEPLETPTEVAVGAIWAEMLDAERVGAKDDFFALGGHSLVATRVLSRLVRTFGVDLPLRAFFEHRTVRALAAEIDALAQAEALAGERTEHAPKDELEPIPVLDRSGDAVTIPLSHGQKRLWFLDQLDPGSPLYNVPAAVELAGILDVDALTAALGDLVNRHEPLRTRFENRDGQPVQVIDPVGDLEVAIEDLAALHGESTAARAAALEIAADEARRPFDLERGPLIRTRILRLGKTLHILLVSQHHIISDGWSVGILSRELAELYRARLENRDPRLRTLELQYADYAAWHRGWLEGGVLDRQLSYWRGQLRGRPQVLELPLDRPRGSKARIDGRRVHFELEPALVDALHQLASRVDGTLYMVLLAAFQALLHRYSHQDMVLVGSPVAQRRRQEAEGLVGFFVNNLVMRADFDGDPTFLDLLGQVRDTTLEAFEHQDVPFERLVEELESDRNLAYSPLFQAVLVLQNQPPPLLDLPGVRWTVLEVDSEVAKFDLTLVLEERPHGSRGNVLAGHLTYPVDLFEPSTMDRLLGHFARLLRSVTDRPETPVSSVELLSEAELRHLLEERHPAGRGASFTSPAPEDTLTGRFAARMAEQGSSIAVSCEGQTLTYAELGRLANRLAHRLIRLGVGPESKVALCVERSLDLVVGILGILQAGGAYVPLDPNYPKDRLFFLLEDSDAKVLLTRDDLLDRLPATGIDVLPLGDLALEHPEDSDAPPPPRAMADNLAYVIYTSGSTGRPKGVGVTHANVLRLFDATDAWFQFDAQDVWTLFHSFAFDFSVWELWGALLYGGRLVIVPYVVSRAPDEFLHLLEDEGVTVLNQTPSMFRQVDQTDAELTAAGKAPKLALRYVVFGGEALSIPSLASWWERRGADTPRLINMYGITETTVHVTFRPLGPELLEQGAESVIGEPIPDLQLFVLDRRRRLVPEGVAGEISVGGAGLARGYLDRPALTAQRFVPNPHGSEPGGRLYLSGDLGRLVPPADLEYRGRIDHQVKIRGHRIEPGEIASALEAHDEVARAFVMPWGRGSDQRLVAYYVPQADQRERLREEVRSLEGVAGPAAKTLEEFLSASLPEYMVPSAYIALAELPITAHGKLDRKQLPDPTFGKRADAVDIAPRTPTEHAVLDIWKEVLGTEHIGIEDHFFDVGGHSLLSTQVVSKIRRRFAVDLGLRRMFEGPTVAELATEIDQLLGADVFVDDLPPIERCEDQGPWPLSHSQKTFWLEDQLQEDRAVYNVPLALEIHGDVDFHALRVAIMDLMGRHEILRTAFDVIDGTPVQRLSEASEPDLRRLDLRPLTPEDRAAEIERLIHEEASTPFDLGEGRPHRLTLVALEDGRSMLFWTLHHIVCDAWSLGILWTELSESYAAHVAGRSVDLGPRPLQYADFAVWQTQNISGERLGTLLRYWRRRLAGAPSLCTPPPDLPRPERRGARGKKLPLRLPPELLGQLRVLANAHDATPFMVLVAAVQLLLGFDTNSDDVVVGTNVASRAHTGTEGMVGPLMNQLVLRSHLGGEPTFAQWLERVRDVVLEAYGHQDLPFELLAGELAPETEAAVSPLFQVKVEWLNLPVRRDALGDLPVVPTVREETIVRFDQHWVLEETRRGLEGWLRYDDSLYQAETCEQQAKLLIEIFEIATSAPDTPIDQILDHLRSLAAEELRQRRLKRRRQRKVGIGRVRRKAVVRT